MGYSPQIFMPIIDEHHWFLIVFSRKENIFYILDSFPSDTRVSKIESILSILKEQLQESTPGAHEHKQGNDTETDLKDAGDEKGVKRNKQSKRTTSKLDSLELVPSACGRQVNCSNYSGTLDLARSWLEVKKLEEVYKLVTDDWYVSGNLMIIFL